MTIHVSARVTLFWVDRSKECKDYRGKICLFARRNPGSTDRFDCVRPGDWHIASIPCAPRSTLTARKRQTVEVVARTICYARAQLTVLADTIVGVAPE